MDSFYEQLYKQIKVLPRLKFARLINALISADELDFLPKPITDISKVEFLGYMKESGRLEEVNNYLKNMMGVTDSPTPTIFINQIEAIEEAMRPFYPPYRIIQGPAGYGKTKLLNKLKENYSEKEAPWECAFISISEKETTDSLILKLSEALGIVELLNRNPNLTINKRFSNALFIKWNEIITEERTGNNPQKKGLCLLFDLNKRPFETILSSLFSEIFPPIQEYLFSLGAFKSKEKKFVVIIGGRYLSRFSDTWKNTSSPIAPIIIELKPFTFDVIRQATKQYLVNLDNNIIIDELAVYLSFLTGGHPGCVFSILELYEQKGLSIPLQFFSEYNEKIWVDIISKPISETYKDMPQTPVWLPEVFERLSIYRKIDEVILNRLMDEFNLSDKVIDAYQLADLLTTTYLINRHEHILKDDITRRLLVIGLRHKKPDDFPKYCRNARDIYEEKTRNDSVTSIEPAHWAIEYLFQCLQQYSPIIHDSELRQEIRKTFFNKEVPHILDLLIQNRNITSKNITWELQVINDALEDDWEFKLYVNYYLSDSQISVAPFQELRDHITKYFHKIGEMK
jgi:hypothetical protein